MTSALAVSPSSVLQKLERIRAAIAECKTLAEVKPLRDMAVTARLHAKRAHLSRDIQHDVGEMVLLATCTAGEMLNQLERKHVPGPGRGNKEPASVAGGFSEYAQTLKDTDTPERTARRWQLMSEIPVTVRMKYIADIQKADNGDITCAGLISFAYHPKSAKKGKTWGEMLTNLALRIEGCRDRVKRAIGVRDELWEGCPDEMAALVKAINDTDLASLIPLLERQSVGTREQESLEPADSADSQALKDADNSTEAAAA